MFRRRKPIDPLDQPLLVWPDGTPLTQRAFLRNIAIFGQTGSGKSSASGFQLALAIVALRCSGGLILASKPGDRAFWEGVFQRCGRCDDLIIFGPGEKPRCNFLESLGGDSFNITKCVLTIGESLRKEEGGKGDAFWQQQRERGIHLAVDILKMAGEKPSAPNIQKFFVMAAQKPDDLKDAAWQGRFHNRCFTAAHARSKNPIEQYDYEQAWDFWLLEWPVMNDRTRTSVVADVMGVLHPMNSGITRDLISTITTVSPADMDKGKWILVDMNLKQYGESARAVLAGWKYITQRFVLQRKEWHNPIVIWCDEAQEVVNSEDSTYLAQCRSHGGCMLYLTQSVHSYMSAMKEHKAKELLANFHHQIFHVVDAETAAYASALLGDRLETTYGGNERGDATVGDEIFGPGRFSGSFNRDYKPVLQPRCFQSGLRCGSEENGYVADAIVLRSGEPFLCGENYQVVGFSQR